VQFFKEPEHDVISIPPFCPGFKLLGHPQAVLDPGGRVCVDAGAHTGQDGRAKDAPSEVSKVITFFW